jgi:anti-sigma-K factor RskA
MEIEDRDIEMIEDYLLGRLSREDKEAIEQRMEKNSAFAEEVDFMRSLIAASREKGEERVEQLREEMGLEKEDDQREPQQKEKPEAQNQLFPRILIIVIAATLLTAILLIVL